MLQTSKSSYRWKRQPRNFGSIKKPEVKVFKFFSRSHFSHGWTEHLAGLKLARQGFTMRHFTCFLLNLKYKGKSARAEKKIRNSSEWERNPRLLQFLLIEFIKISSGDFSNSHGSHQIFYAPFSSEMQFIRHTHFLIILCLLVFLVAKQQYEFFDTTVCE